MTSDEKLGQMIDDAMATYGRACEELEAKGYPAEVIIQGLLARASVDAVAHGYCVDMLHEFIGGFAADATVAQAKCPHCNGTEASRRS